ncbi:MAG: hypothetical protein M3Y37_04865 [Chloroflexota bacterium]|nr:hypothetical protein [Chloroflexota bacterium]
MGSRDQIQIDGVPIRIHGNFEREVTDESGQRVGELEVVVIIRGRMPNKQFVQLLARDTLRIDLVDGDGFMSMYCRIANHSAVASGAGEGVVFRHDITFRESAESYRRRMEEKAASQPAAPEPPPVRKPSQPEPPPVENISQVLANADPSGWGEAIRQLKTSQLPKSAVAVADEPLTMAELTAIETVLTNLRVDALIDQLEGAGLLRRSAVDERFRSLIERRFVSEAIPLVGEKVARRALREMDQ